MRTFVAVNLTSELKEEVSTLCKGFRRNIRGPARWVKKENLHFTLKFLGEISKDDILPITSALERAVAAHSPFCLSLAGPGVFPSVEKPGVFWLGVKEGARELDRLHLVIEKELSTFGFNPDKRSYHPHLTLARFKGQIKGLKKVLDNCCIEKNLSMMVKEVCFMESRLHRSGPEYFILKKIPLNQ